MGHVLGVTTTTKSHKALYQSERDSSVNKNKKELKWACFNGGMMIHAHRIHTQWGTDETEFFASKTPLNQYGKGSQQ